MKTFLAKLLGLPTPAQIATLQAEKRAAVIKGNMNVERTLREAQEFAVMWRNQAKSDKKRTAELDKVASAITTMVLKAESVNKAEISKVQACLGK